MEKTLSEKKEQKIENLVSDAKDSATAGRDTENQLSNNLISITLAFVALLATAISTSNVLKTINFEQKMVIMSSIVVFCASITIGLLNYFLNMRFHQKAAKASRTKARKAKTADTNTELSSVNREAITQPAQPTRRNNFLITLQIILLIIGLTLCVIFMGMMLFLTSNEV